MRTDLAAEARRAIQNARTARRAGDGIGYPETAISLAESQVEATLAVAEQLRVANEIAILTQPDYVVARFAAVSTVIDLNGIAADVLAVLGIPATPAETEPE